MCWLAANRLHDAPLFRPADTLKIAAACWLLLTFFYMGVGRRQSDEAGGAVSRLAWTAALAALLALVPLDVWLAIHLRQSATPESRIAIICLSALSAFSVLRWLLPFRGGGKTPLPLVDDPGFVARVAQLALAMNIDPPRTRLFRTVGGQQRISAWAHGLAKPAIVIADGVLHRLRPAERDAIMAHEIGHIANHSLWLMSLVGPLTCLGSVAVEASFRFDLAATFGFLLYVGLRRVVSRPIEADCDRRAGRAIGFQQTISALSKVHAAAPVRSSLEFAAGLCASDASVARSGD